jgi:hypothetical protein
MISSAIRVPMSILGLNYCCGLDRTQGACGVIRFAPISSNEGAVQ